MEEYWSFEVWERGKKNPQKHQTAKILYPSSEICKCTGWTEYPKRGYACSKSHCTSFGASLELSCQQAFPCFLWVCWALRKCKILTATRKKTFYWEQCESLQGEHRGAAKKQLPHVSNSQWNEGSTTCKENKAMWFKLLSDRLLFFFFFPSDINSCWVKVIFTEPEASQPFAASWNKGTMSKHWKAEVPVSSNLELSTQVPKWVLKCLYCHSVW